MLHCRLVEDTFNDLEDSGCIRVDDNRVEPTMLGSIASQYYLSYTTVSMFGSNISLDTSLEVIIIICFVYMARNLHLLLAHCPIFSQVFLHILSGASEYDELPVRHNEVC